MKVFVAGGTGAIGVHAVPALVAATHDVTAMARTPAKAAWLTARGARPVPASLFDRRELREAMTGHDAVVNLATALPPTWRFMSRRAWDRNNRVRSEGSAALVDAAISVGVRVLVQESVSMLYPDRGSQWIDEHVPVDSYPNARGNLDAEANANRYSATGATGVILRLGLFYGPGAKHSEQFFALARRHVCVMMGRPSTFVSSIHVADAGEAVVIALEAPAGVYNVVDDEPLTKFEYADALAAATGKRAWLRVPGRWAEVLGDRSTSLTRSLRVSNARFRTVTGWAPRYPSARDGWKTMAQVRGD